MNRFYFGLSIIIILILLSCKNNQNNSTENADSIQTENAFPEEDADIIKNTLLAFQNTDEETIAAGEQNYLLMLENYSESEPTENEKLWYRQNVAHVDSVSRQALSLFESKNYTQLQNLLESELPYLQSHPAMDTYLWFDMDCVLATLYYLNDLDEITINSKMASQWELQRVRIEAIQSGWDEPHPLYKPVLQFLYQIYDNLGNEPKKTEISEILKLFE